MHVLDGEGTYPGGRQVPLVGAAKMRLRIRHIVPTLQGEAEVPLRP